MGSHSGGEEKPLGEDGELVEVSAGELGLVKAEDEAEVGAAEVSVVEVGAVEVGSTEVCPAEDGALEIGPGEIGSAKIGSSEVDAAQVGTGEVGSAKIGGDEAGHVEVGVTEIGFAQVGAGEVGAREIDVVQRGGDEASAIEIRERVGVLLTPIVPGGESGAEESEMHLVGREGGRNARSKFEGWSCGSHGAAVLTSNVRPFALKRTPAVHPDAAKENSEGGNRPVLERGGPEGDIGNA